MARFRLPRTIAPALIALVAGGLAGCYERVVEAPPDYAGEVYEPNLKEPQDSMWENDQQQKRTPWKK